MRYDDARRLHNEDQVIVRKTGQVLMVVETRLVAPEKTAGLAPAVQVMLDDGNWYHHREIA